MSIVTSPQRARLFHLSNVQGVVSSDTVGVHMSFDQFDSSQLDVIVRLQVRRRCSCSLDSKPTLKHREPG